MWLIVNTNWAVCTLLSYRTLLSFSIFTSQLSSLEPLVPAHAAENSETDTHFAIGLSAGLIDTLNPWLSTRLTDRKSVV